MCRLFIAYNCGHSALQAVACPQSMHYHTDEWARKARNQLVNVDNLSADFGCAAVRGKVEVGCGCPQCALQPPVFFVRKRALIPPCEIPPWDTEGFRTATLCEFYSSFFIDKEHVEGEDICCERMLLCSSVVLEHGRPGETCDNCRFAGPVSETIVWNHPGLPRPCLDWRPNPVYAFEPVVIRNLGPHVLKRASTLKRVNTFLRSKMRKREASPPPPSRQNTLDWAAQATEQAIEAARQKEAIENPFGW